MKRIGIMGGTFDPIHVGHLIMAESAREQFELDEVRFIPAGNPPHKDDEKIGSDRLRFEMVALAIEDNPGFTVSSLEIDEEKPSYTYDTMTRLKRENPEEKHYFIMGEDSLMTIEKWYRYEELLKLIRILAAKRYSVPSPSFLDRIRELNHAGAHVELLHTPIVEVSSTDIRERVARGQSIRYQVTPCVEKFIREKGLYRK
jgi:nicotinate-nucleotide adenylyltransferase